MDKAKFEPVTITLTLAAREMLEALMRWRHPDDGRVVSLTIRECIREAYERDLAAIKAREEHGK